MLPPPIGTTQLVPKSVSRPSVNRTPSVATVKPVATIKSTGKMPVTSSTTLTTTDYADEEPVSNFFTLDDETSKPTTSFHRFSLHLPKPVVAVEQADDTEDEPSTSSAIQLQASSNGEIDPESSAAEVDTV